MGLLRASAQRSILLILIGCILAIRLLAGATVVLSAIEQTEVYGGVCWSIDPECSVTEQHEVRLGDAPSSELNLSFHLMGSLLAVETELINLACDAQALHAYEKTLPQWVFATTIFHPPRDFSLTTPV